MNKQDLASKESEHAAKVRKEAETSALILASLPELPYYKNVHGYGFKCDGWVILTVNNGTQLLEAYKALPPVELVKYSDSCTSFFPLEKMTDEESQTDKGTPVSPFLFKLEGFNFEGSSTSKEYTFEWFSKLGSLMIKVEVNLQFDFKFVNMPDIFRVQKEIAFKQYEWVWEASPGIKVVGERIKWYQDSEHGQYTYYWNESEAEDLDEVIPDIWLGSIEENVKI